MRKNIFLAALLALTCLTASAQRSDDAPFAHYAIGLSAGTTGVGIDLATTVGSHVQLRTGVDIMPNISFDTDLDLTRPENTSRSFPDEIAVTGKVGFTNFKLLADIFPFRGSSFRLTAGFYAGGAKVVKAHNTVEGALLEVTQWNHDNPNRLIGVELGDHLLTPDARGNVDAYVKVAGMKPYIGLGFGRAVPKKRVSVMMDLGCQLWGSPKVYCNDLEVTEGDVEGNGGDILKTLSKITVYPVINIRLCGRLF